MRRSDKPSLWFLSHDTLEKTWASRMCPTGKWERPCVPDSAMTSALLILLTSSAADFELLADSYLCIQAIEEMQ